MAKPAIADEVMVLRFFESGPIEKAEVVFNIVSEKMRERLHGATRDYDRAAQPGSPRKRNAPGNQKGQGVESAERARKDDGQFGLGFICCGGKGTPNTTFMEQAQPCNQKQREMFARLVEEAKKRESETLESGYDLQRRIEKEVVLKLAKEEAGVSELIAKVGQLRKELDVAEKALGDLGFCLHRDRPELNSNAPAKLRKALETAQRSARIERERSLKKYDLAILGVWSAESAGEAKGIVEALL